MNATEGGNMMTMVDPDDVRGRRLLDAAIDPHSEPSLGRTLHRDEVHHQLAGLLYTHGSGRRQNIWGGSSARLNLRHQCVAVRHRMNCGRLC